MMPVSSAVLLFAFSAPRCHSDSVSSSTWPHSSSNSSSSEPQAESGGCVVLSGHLAAMMGPPGRPGGVEVGYPPRTPAQARVCAAPGDVPAPCPRSPRGYRSMVRVAIGSAIHHFSLFHSRPVAIDTA
eukprot:COSAG01_NODE_1639_length_9653_cov_33.252564_3_plen_128_part_00